MFNDQKFCVNLFLRGGSKKTLTFLDVIFSRFLISSGRLLLTCVNNDVCSIFHENGIENNEIFFKGRVFEKVDEIFLCPQVCQWTLGSSYKVDPKLGKKVTKWK